MVLHFQPSKFEYVSHYRSLKIINFNVNEQKLVIHLSVIRNCASNIIRLAYIRLKYNFPVCDNYNSTKCSNWELS